jgi:polyribonucleotide nucleotidyltransferase
MNKIELKVDFGGKEITLETGRLAKQADGSVLATCGNNMVLVTAVASRKQSDADFFPLTVEYAEKFYSSGKIPGGFFKREGRPSTDATLSARQIDRPLRPSFPEGFRQETQVVATILSSDGQFPAEVLASVAASAAVHISDIPFNGPTAAVLVGRVNGQWVANPSESQLVESDASIIIAGTKNGILMVEGESKFISEAECLEALKFGHQSMLPVLALQEELREKVGRPKREFTPFKVTEEIENQVRDFLTPRLKSALGNRIKQERYLAMDLAKEEALKTFVTSDLEGAAKSIRTKEVLSLIETIKYEQARSMILNDGIRIDGRDMVTVRPIWCEAGILPRAHGSGLFTRGETQVLGTVTLGTGDDELFVDALTGSYKKSFFLHYNFPPFSVGETGRMGGGSRREIGHGFLAERALKAVLPPAAEFPYTIRVVGEVFESNGSSSMGTVCSGTMALLDAGVPIRGNVAGVAMGLITDGSKVAVLTDILGDEDHLGDMDFKVAGTREGITALQMDIKIDSLTFDVIETALKQALDGRNHILAEMEKTIKVPRGEISEFAPRIEIIKIKPDKVREVIGAGGKTVRGIIDETGVKINIEDDGSIHVSSSDPEARRKAIAIIQSIIAEPEPGMVYTGKVKKIMDFGAFVEILPNCEGLLHISEIDHQRVRQVSDFLSEGDTVEVKCLEVDRSGRIKLSRKALMERPQ